ncbi:conserved hypothetical protein [Sphingomonas sp. EC-HK361]|uniref:DUF6445 family protein n=1 Tax=Sphingomonas sp. EC-HK361 TaxID=2038397 RepID=UPI0012543322|nr:DUF6445 family protein [Sphingomonas sp. EC-HK361]VVS98977.1 conserved hypothetical protein [Sphingomonas sp. EC-HK361]
MTPSVSVERVGGEGEPIVVIDNFAPDPDALVDAAAAITLAAAGEFYPGPRAPAPPEYFAQVGGLVAAAVRKVFGYHDHLAVDRALFSLATTDPADLSLAQRIPHVDSVEPGRIAIVHYLSRTDFGGTRFFRHRATGFETIDAVRHRAYLDALAAEFATQGEPPPGYISTDSPLFETIATVPPTWNRAILYRSGLLHCAAIPNDIELPADARTGRLTIASFLTAR